MRKKSLLFALLALGLLVSCDDTPKVVPTTVSTKLAGEDKPSQTSYNTSMNFSSGGMLRAVLHAGRVRTYERTHSTWLDSSVRVDFYDRMGQHSSVLTSKSAKINTEVNDMFAYGNVRIVSDSGTTVDTDSLEWKNQTQMLHSDCHVHIVERSGRVTDGNGFESDQNLERYHILRPTIVAPADALGATRRPSSQNENALKPPTPQIPGAGAMKATQLPISPLPGDTAHSPR